MSRRLLTMADLMACFQCGRTTAYRAMKQMPTVHIGNLVRVTEEALEEFIRARTFPPEWPRISPPAPRALLPPLRKSKVKPESKGSAPLTAEDLERIRRMAREDVAAARQRRR